jgi:mRNA-degrading endonuclease RelE of RelBE toxin-antitoxin system
VLEALDRLRENPALGKPLRGQFAGRRAFRIGAYRIIYRIAGDAMVVNAVGHRSTIYRQP